MTVAELLESLGLDDLIDLAQSENQLSDEQEYVLDQEVKVHFQPSYPLVASLDNARILNGEVVLALGEGTSYGTRKAWEQDY